jgi:hypothetical protein
LLRFAGVTLEGIDKQPGRPAEDDDLAVLVKDVEGRPRA